MGYRNFLGTFPKKHISKYRKKSIEALNEEFGEFDGENKVFNLATPEELIQIIQVENLKLFNRSLWEDFYSFSCSQHEYECYILRKEDLKNIIDLYHQELEKYYEIKLNEIKSLYELKKSEDLEAFNKNFNQTMSSLYSLFFNRKNTWDTSYKYKFYKLDKKNDLNLGDTGIYEHDVFTLINIYKNFDWDKNYLIFNGW